MFKISAQEYAMKDLMKMVENKSNFLFKWVSLFFLVYSRKKKKF